MATVEFSQKAEADLLDIGLYTLSMWGSSQTLRYINEIEDACQRLADFPTSGRLCEHIRPGLRRTEQGRHVIFYRISENGILVSRILHERMLPEQRDMDE